MISLSGKVALVTGGGTGIGKAIAAAFHQAGARVAIASRDPEHLKKATSVLAARGADGSGELLPLRLDARRAETVDLAVGSLVESWGRVDILVNNAGVSGQNPIQGDKAAGDAKWHDVIATNLTGAYLVTRAVLPHMPEGGRIINNASVLGKFGVAGYSAYCASKHGLIGFTRALAAELAPRRITVNAICPGWVDTVMAEQGVQETAKRLGVAPDQFKKAAMDRVPLGRFIRPEEIAPLALYLASEDSAAMTGQAINIEGGATTW
jgi:ketoreductase